MVNPVWVIRSWLVGGAGRQQEEEAGGAALQRWLSGAWHVQMSASAQAAMSTVQYGVYSM